MEINSFDKVFWIIFNPENSGVYIEERYKALYIFTTLEKIKGYAKNQKISRSEAKLFKWSELYEEFYLCYDYVIIDAVGHREEEITLVDFERNLKINRLNESGIKESHA